MQLAGCKIKVHGRGFVLKIWYDEGNKKAVYNKRFSKRNFGELIDEVKKITDIIEGGEKNEDV